MRFEQLENRKLLSVWPASTLDTHPDDSPVADVSRACPSGEETLIRLEDHLDLVHLLENKAKSEEQWFLLLSGLVALMPRDTPKTTGNVTEFANKLIGKRSINPLKRDSVNYALRNKPRLRKRVGMVSPRERKRTGQEWTTLLKSAVNNLPGGVLPTVSNIAFHSNGLLTVQMIRNAMMWHDIRAFKQGWMQREHEVPRSRDGWITLLKQAVAELPAGIPPTSNEIETLTFGQIKRAQIASAMHRFDVPYREVGLAREVIVAKAKEEWMNLLKDCAKQVRQPASPTPYHVGPLVYERNGAEIVRDVLWYYDIKHPEVGMVPLPQSSAEWLEAIQRARQNMKPGRKPTPRIIAGCSRHEFTFPELKQALKSPGRGGFGITYEKAGLQKETRPKRSLEERIQMIKSAAQDIFDTTGYYATPQDVGALLSKSHDEDFTPTHVVGAIREAGVTSYEDLNMITSKRGRHVQVHSTAQAIGVQSELLDGDEDGTGAQFVAARSRSIAPDARLDVEDAIHRTRLRLPHDEAKLVDDVVAKLRSESDLLYDIDALAESLDRTPEQVHLTLRALHEVFGEGSWDHTLGDEEQTEPVPHVSSRTPEEDNTPERRPEGNETSARPSIPEHAVPVHQLLRRILIPLTHCPDSDSAARSITHQ